LAFFFSGQNNDSAGFSNKEYLMHIRESKLRAYLDSEISQSERAVIDQHLQECAICNQRLRAVEQHMQLANHRLAPLMTARGLVRPSAAWKMVQNHQKEKNMQTLFRKPAFTGLVILSIFLVSLAFPPVRALASDFLGLFRVDQVRVIPFDLSYVDQLASGTQTSRTQIDTFFRENITETHQGTFQVAETVQELASLIGYTPRLPELEATTMGVEPGVEMTIKLDTELINSVLSTLELDTYQISDELNGKTIAVHVPTSVVFTWGPCDLPADPTDPDDQWMNCTSLVQMRSPQADIPQGLDVAHLGEAFFQAIGMSPENAAALSNSIDWTTTLILPIPVGEGVQYQEVRVDGVAGSLVTDATLKTQTIIWSRAGMLYALQTSQPDIDLLAIANNLK
jgi:hypothetical protein